MVKVAMTSDNHFDVNRIDSVEMGKRQAEYLHQQQVKIYLIAGDLFNNFENSLNYVRQLDHEVGADMQVRWIAGNHDMLNAVTYDELENLTAPTYLHNHYLDIANTKWRIIGNNGWYDYSLAEETGSTDDFVKWKRAYWIDGGIKQPMSDLQRMGIVLHQTEKILQDATLTDKKILFMTHFSPRKEYIQVHPEIRMWNMSNGMMGSLHLGEMLKQYHVQKVLFGHLHLHVNSRILDDTTFYNQAVGYHKKRHNEWYMDNFFDQWREQLKIVNLT